ncbi:MAG: permease-like cell division protein FtsX [Clostridia bacterium]|nr:permease-like cell division protein FtsX [Clostridia bacterium]
MSGSIRYLTKEGFRNVWVNRLMSIASVCVLMSCLILTGIAFLLYVNVQSLLDVVDDQNVIVVFVDSNLTPAEIESVGNNIDAISNIESIVYRSAEENTADFYEEYKNELFVDYFENEEGNIVPASFEIHLADMELFDDTLKQIEALENIQNVRESKDLSNILVAIRRFTTYFSLGAVAMLLLISLFIISNTVRITMHSRRLEISIMKNVGATNSFIRWPFMVEGMVLGSFSGLVSLGIVYGLYELVSTLSASFIGSFGSLSLVPFSQYWYWILIGFEVIGIFTGGLGSAISIKKYLKEKDYDETHEE